eukprot:3004960-Prymnesium_polylepis.1
MHQPRDAYAIRYSVCADCPARSCLSNLSSPLAVGVKSITYCVKHATFCAHGPESFQIDRTTKIYRQSAAVASMS